MNKELNNRLIFKARLHAANYNTKYIISINPKLNKKQVKEMLDLFFKHYPEFNMLKKNK